MWRNYFGEKCHIYGVDIEPACRSYQKEGIDVFIGDQSDRAFWKEMREKVPRVDILIDNGSHGPEHQRITLEEMLSHLQPGGVYLCEDVGTQANRFGGFMAGPASVFNALMKVVEEFDAPVAPSNFQASVSSITQYPFVTVIEKLETNPRQFVSRRQGTEWQPY